MDLALYSPLLQKLLAEERLNELGPGRPNNAVLPLLENLTVGNAFMPLEVKDRALAESCLAGIWLYHDFLEESHRISQDLPGVEGSYWHGLMHRREPDFGNAKYWFRQVGNHLVFESLQKKAAALSAETIIPGAEFLEKQHRWDPFAFIDLYEAATLGKYQDPLLCRRIQQMEWQYLFDYCFLGATGQNSA